MDGCIYVEESLHHERAEGKSSATLRNHRRELKALSGWVSAQTTVSGAIRGVTGVELEFAAEGKLHPSRLLGELPGVRGSGQTSPDVAFFVELEDGTRGLLLVECRLAEHSFYQCSGRSTKDGDRGPGNPDPGRCKDVRRPGPDPRAGRHQVIWGRRYWDLLWPITDGGEFSRLSECPAATAGYQLFGQQALAEGIAAAGGYGLVVSCAAYDSRNDGLMRCLHRAGMADIRAGWPKLFGGRAGFAAFTHQEWVAWVRRQEPVGELQDWLAYVADRYGY